MVTVRYAMLRHGDDYGVAPRMMLLATGRLCSVYASYIICHGGVHADTPDYFPVMLDA